MRFHHVGIATDNVDEELEKWINILELLGINYSIIREFDNSQQVELCLVEFGNLAIEFVSGNKVCSFLDKGIKIYHICFEVESLNSSVEVLVDRGWMLITPPMSSVIFNQRRFAFLINPQKVLIELLEAKFEDSCTI